MNNQLILEWLGTAGFRFKFRGKVVLLDPYITRVQDRKTPILPDPTYISKYIDRADYIIVSHGHYDHFADTPTIARMTGATVVGSYTVLNACRSFEIPEKQLRKAGSHDTLKFPEFSVTYTPSQHGLNSEGVVPFAGFFQEPPRPQPRIASDFKEGGTFAPFFKFGSIRVLQIGSANFLEDEIKNLHTDILLLCIAWREKVPNFVERVLNNTRPKVVIPMHYDDYWTPLERGLVLREDTSLDAFIQEVKTTSMDAKVITLGLFEEYAVGPF